MPIYEYQCQSCGARFDKFVRSMSTQFAVQCPECGSEDCKKAHSLFGTAGGATVGAGASCAPSG